TGRAPGRPAAAGPAGGSTLRRSACSPRRPPARSGLRPRRKGQGAWLRDVRTGGPVGGEERKEDGDALEAASDRRGCSLGPEAVERAAGARMGGLPDLRAIIAQTGDPCRTCGGSATKCTQNAAFRSLFPVAPTGGTGSIRP